MKFEQKYIDEINFLVANPSEVKRYWETTSSLFQCLGKDGRDSHLIGSEKVKIGCATLVKVGNWGACADSPNGFQNNVIAIAQTDELTKAIQRSDIPTTEELFKLAKEATKNRANKRKLKKVLEKFAFIQTVCDFLYNRV